MISKLEENSQKKSTILLVDDLPANIQLLAEVLGKEGFSIIAAENGSTAIAAAVKYLPDIILLDINMPEMSGFEVCTILKKMIQFQETPIIFLTSRNDTSDIVKGLSHGAVDYITKPFQKEELLARVRIQLELKKLRDEKQDLIQRLQQALQLVGVLSNKSNTLNHFAENYKLSDREKEVLQLVFQGLPTKEIADKINVSAGTAKNHVLNLLKKTNTHSRAELFAVFNESYKI